MLNKKMLLVAAALLSLGYGEGDLQTLKQNLEQARDSVEALDHHIHQAILSGDLSSAQIDSLKFLQKKEKQRVVQLRDVLQAEVELSSATPSKGLAPLAKVLLILMGLSALFLVFYYRYKQRQSQKIKAKMDSLANSPPTSSITKTFRSLSQVSKDLSEEWSHKQRAVSSEQPEEQEKFSEEVSTKAPLELNKNLNESLPEAKVEEMEFPPINSFVEKGTFDPKVNEPTLEMSRGHILKLAKRGATATEISRRLQLSREQVELVIRYELEKKH